MPSKTKVVNKNNNKVNNNYLLKVISISLLSMFTHMQESLVQKQPPEVYSKKGTLKSFTKFTGKHLHWSFFFKKVAGLSSATVLKRRLRRRCVLVNFA